MPQITVENLVKTFKVGKRQAGLWNAMKGVVHREYTTVRALDGISFSLEHGELVGYIGPNGAGKSTTVKVLSGILVPDSGRCEVMGLVPWRARVPHVRRIGVVFGQRCQLWWDLPVIDSFELLKDIYRISPEDYRKTRDELVDRLRLADLLEVPVRQLSLGQRMRCDLAASLLHTPSILFLDEPTIGLDAPSKLAVREFIKDLNREKGITMILTTHDLNDIEALCQRVVLIGKGHILLDGSLEQLRSQVTSERRLIAELLTNGQEIDIPGVRIAKHDGNRLCLYFDPEQIAPSDLIARLSSQFTVRDFFVENPPIEEIVARLYGEWNI
ncbi:MAG: ABC transporter ATP-binding protein [Bacillota bacterium]|nr:ABC transporter ATP-binding protein [Bacillota bacterium]